MADEAGEIVVFKVRREEDAGEFRWVPDHEALPTRAPRNDGIRRRIIHHLIRLQEEWRRPTAGGTTRGSSIHSDAISQNWGSGLDFSV